MILPASFTASRRYMFEHCQDAMAICSYFGYLDLFITFTCKSNWMEIKDELTFIPGQRAEDRPDIVSPVYRIKLKYLIQDLMINSHFGQAVASKIT